MGSISADSTIPLHERISATSTLNPLVSASYNQSHVQQRTTPATQSAATSQESLSQSNLVDELLQENSRLTQEVQHLRSLVAREQQTQSQLQNQQPTNYMAARSPITGTQVSDTTNPPAAGVKYVCCGACRQWLLAPTEVSYVVCSRCQAVNNCNLTPLNRVSGLFNFLRLASIQSQTLLLHRFIERRKGSRFSSQVCSFNLFFSIVGKINVLIVHLFRRSDLPWFLDCLTRPFSGYYS